MGKSGSKIKSFSQNKSNANDLQILLKNRFDEIANGKPTIDKSVFFEYTESTICPQLQSFIYDSLSESDDVIMLERFIQFAEMMLGDFNQQAKVLLQFNQPIKQIIEKVFYFSLIFSWKDSTKLLPQASKNSLLTPAALCLVYANLPEELRDRWKLLFSSEKHGESFTKLMKSVDHAGPCLIIIETTSDRVFGAFASQGFICGPRHTGDNQCFLFEDRRKLHIYSATGYNSNFAYLNSGQVSLPNGIGMGGQVWLIGEKCKESTDAELEGNISEQRVLMNRNEARLLLELSGISDSSPDN
ncbi:MTOR-associated protein [Dirofilaria immitis]